MWMLIIAPAVVKILVCFLEEFVRLKEEMNDD